MLSAVSWTQFICSILIASAIYYFFIWLVFFKAKFSFATSIERTPEMHSSAEMKAKLAPLFAARYNKNELILALQVKLRQYKGNEPGFREGMEEFIVAACKEKCELNLDEVDRRMLWH